MITFKPYFETFKRTKDTHDFFHISLYLCNMLQFSISIYGYGFSMGVLLYDVTKVKK